MALKHRQGFSLAEALITMVIISLVMAATMPIVIRSQNSPSEAPWKYVTQGDLVQNSAVYTVLGETAVSVFGDKRVPIDKNISTDKDTIFATKINPKISIVTRSRTAGPVLQRHLLDFYEKETNGNYTNIGKISFDQFFNLALGQNALDYIKHNATTQQKVTFTAGTATNWNEITRLASGGIDATQTIGAANTAVGQYSMAGNLRYTNLDTTANAEPNITGVANTALGAFSMRRLSSGHLNTGVGTYALHEAQTSSYNTAVGGYALKLTSSGIQNTAVGTFAMESNTSGGDNTAIGVMAAQKNTTGTHNVAVGNSSLGANTTGIRNTALGYGALLSNTTGNYNIALGSETLRSNSTGTYNIAIGNYALQGNSTGYGNIVIGNNIGYGNYNNKLYIGGYVKNSAAASPDMGYNSTDALFYGDMSTQELTLNTKTLYLGLSDAPAGSIISLRSKEISYGLSDKTTKHTVYGDITTNSTTNSFGANTTNIGNGDGSTTYLLGTAYIKRGANNYKIATLYDIQQILGSTVANSLGYPVYYNSSLLNTSISDARLKNILGDNTAGLKEVMQLNVKNYTMKRDKKKEILVGVIAQELQKVFPNSVIEGRDGYLRIKRDEIFYACINAIKELNNMIQDVIAKITGLEEKIRILEDTNKLNEEKIAALEKQNKLFEERLAALENNAKKVKEAKEIKETKKAKESIKTEKNEQQEVVNEEKAKEENK